MNQKVMDAVGFISRFVTDHWDSLSGSSDVHNELSNQGFSTREITDAFKWIEANTLGSQPTENEVSVQPAMRVLSVSESSKMSTQAQGILMLYYDRGLIDAMILEEILDRVQRSEEEEIDEKEMRRITALTLFTRVQAEWKELLQTTNTLIH